MLNLQAIFERKENKFPTRDCVIEKIIELPKAEYNNFRSNILNDAEFIMENKDYMYVDSNGIYHCLLVLGENRSEGVLVEAEGYDYARYASFLPGARDFVNARLNELADQIIKKGTQNTSNGAWAVYFEEIQEQYYIPVSPNNGIGLMLLGILEARPEMAGVEPMEDGYDMKFYLDYCPNLDEKEKLMSGLPDDVFRLKDLIRVPMEDFYLVHSEVDMEPATIVYLDSNTLTDEGRREWGDVLNAQVKRVFHGIYGVQAECARVDSKCLADFSLMLAGYCPSEDYDRWIKDAPDSPDMTMKL